MKSNCRGVDCVAKILALAGCDGSDVLREEFAAFRKHPGIENSWRANRSSLRYGVHPRQQRRHEQSGKEKTSQAGFNPKTNGDGRIRAVDADKLLDWDYAVGNKGIGR